MADPNAQLELTPENPELLAGVESPNARPKWSGFFKIVTPEPQIAKQTDSQALGDQGSYGNYTWYQRLVQGSASRLTRYREYDLMDNDLVIAIALDTIAEEMTGLSKKTDDPLILQLVPENEEEVSPMAVLTLKTALRRWSGLHNWENRLFKVARSLIKYGDCFFRKRGTFDKWEYMHPKSVIAALVDKDDITKVLYWQIKADIKEAKGAYGTPITGQQDTETEFVKASEIVRFTLNDDMSDLAPFGESVLRPVYRAWKQKELIEDAIIIYRVQRAPERRVFYIDVGKMPPQRVKTYLEQIKNEIKQKKVPTQQGGAAQVESVYNPQSMSEDFFFASRPDGRGSRVETLPGGQGLGELSDLEYFYSKVLRGLRVPTSYMKEGSEGAVFNDGKVGVAYIQELRFALFCERLQGYLERELDKEFKRFLRNANIKVDETLYRVRLPDPTNFGKYRQQEIDAQLLSTYGSADGIPYMSKRAILKKYLQWTDEEIITNERMIREEKGLSVNGGSEDYMTIYWSTGEEGGGMGGLGGGGFGGGGLGMEGDLGGEELGMDAGGGEEGGGIGEIPGGAAAAPGGVPAT